MSCQHYNKDKHDQLKDDKCTLSDGHSFVLQPYIYGVRDDKEEVITDRHRRSRISSEILPEGQFCIIFLFISKVLYSHIDVNTHDYRRHRSDNSHNYFIFSLFILYLLSPSFLFHCKDSALLFQNTVQVRTFFKGNQTFFEKSVFFIYFAPLRTI